MSPREFWIHDIVEGDYTKTWEETPWEEASWFRHIHVIEYSAYEKLKKQKEIMVIALKDYARRYSDGVYSIPDDAKITLEEMEKIK